MRFGYTAIKRNGQCRCFWEAVFPVPGCVAASSCVVLLSARSLILWSMVPNPTDSHTPGKIKGSQICDFDIHPAVGRIPSLIVYIGQPEFIKPDFRTNDWPAPTFCTPRKNSLHLTEIRISEQWNRTRWVAVSSSLVITRRISAVAFRSIFNWTSRSAGSDSGYWNPARCRCRA